MLRIDVITLFPEMLGPVLNESILKRAQDKGLLCVRVHALRDYGLNKHLITDDSPYGGGAGMVLRPEPIFSAVEKIQADGEPLRVLLASPRGRRFDQAWASELSRETRRIVLLCGHYEGVDERVRIGLDAEGFCIGDYVLTGGELPALVVIDAVARLLPGVLGGEDSLEEESFTQFLLEYPHYTRPAMFRGMGIPEVLLSGHHGEIVRWRRRQSLKITKEMRPDLFERAVREKYITDKDLELLEEV